MQKKITRDYGYDALNRVETVNSSNSLLAQYGYDVLGNLTSRQVGSLPPLTYTYATTGLKPHAVISDTNGSLYQYDANGNLISQTLVLTYLHTCTDSVGSETITMTAVNTQSKHYLYDSENRLARAGVLSTTTYLSATACALSPAAPAARRETTYLYDAGGQLARLTAPGSNTYYAGDHYEEVVNWGWQWPPATRTSWPSAENETIDIPTEANPIHHLTTDGNYLYWLNHLHQGQIYRFDPATGQTSLIKEEGGYLIWFNGALYTGSPGPAGHGELWRWNGANWTKVDDIDQGLFAHPQWLVYLSALHTDGQTLIVNWINVYGDTVTRYTTDGHTFYPAAPSPNLDNVSLHLSGNVRYTPLALLATGQNGWLYRWNGSQFVQANYTPPANYGDLRAGRNYYWVSRDLNADTPYAPDYVYQYSTDLSTWQQADDARISPANTLDVPDAVGWKTGYIHYWDTAADDWSADRESV